jgi:hypothetical protein
LTESHADTPGAGGAGGAGGDAGGAGGAGGGAGGAGGDADTGCNIEVESETVDGCREVDESIVEGVETVEGDSAGGESVGVTTDTVGVIPSSNPSRYVITHNTMTKNNRNNETYIFIPNIFCKTIL